MIIYLTAPRVIRLYAGIQGMTDERASDHLRSPSGLESAVNRPQNYATYENADIPLQAAVLAHGIAETQPFIDGNKRVALAAMLLFLELNGYVLEDVSQEERAAWMLNLSRGWTPDDLARQIRQHGLSILGG